MPAPKGSRNAAGRRVQRDRIKLDLSLSERNGLLDLAGEYVSRQGKQPTDEQIKAFASDWFYQNFGAWLKRQIEIEEAAIIV